MTVPVEQRTVGDFLGELAGRTPAPAAGAATAVTVAGAAALVAMAARFTEGPLSDLAATADLLRADLLDLADDDGPAYQAVLEALRLPRDDPGRRERLTVALQGATEVPLRVAEAAAEVAEMASRLAAEGNPNLVGDAETAAVLAAAATRAVGRMVEVNVRLGGLDHDLLERADRLLGRAGRAEQAMTTKAQP